MYFRDMFENARGPNEGVEDIWPLSDTIFWYSHVIIIPSIAVLGLCGMPVRRYELHLKL